MRERRDPVVPGTSDPPEGGPLPDPGPWQKFHALIGPSANAPSTDNGEATEPRRRLAVIGALAVLIGMAMVALYYLGQAASDWLGRRETYLLRFDQIVLEPEPPAYIKLGRAGLLRQVRERAQAPEELSILNLDPALLAKWFGLHAPWVEEVLRIERSYPNRLVIRLRYREPVALVHQPTGPGIFLDRNAVVLPNREIATEAARPLLRIEGLTSELRIDGQPIPLRTKVGVCVAPTGAEEVEHRAIASCRLAAFLKRRLIEAKALAPGHRPDLIHAKDGADQLWVRTESHFWILWGEPPGEEPAGRSKALEKWEQLLGWFSQPETSRPGENDYLEFRRDGPQLQHGRPPERGASGTSGGSVGRLSP